MSLNLTAEQLKWFSSDQHLPPAYDGNSAVYLLSIFGLMTIFLLSSEWLWKTAWSFRERPKPLKHPVTVTRAVLSFLLLGVLMRVTGDVVLNMSWAEMSPSGRLWVAWTDRLMDGLSAIPMLAAWLLGVLGTMMIDWQLSRQPIPVNLWPSWRDLYRPAMIGLLVLAIAAAVTFLR